MRIHIVGRDAGEYRRPDVIRCYWSNDRNLWELTWGPWPAHADISHKRLSVAVKLVLARILR